MAQQPPVKISSADPVPLPAGTSVIYFGDIFKKQKTAIGTAELTKKVTELINGGYTHFEIHIIS